MERLTCGLPVEDSENLAEYNYVRNCGIAVCRRTYQKRIVPGWHKRLALVVVQVLVCLKCWRV